VEIIGRLIAAFLLMSLASIVGALFALVVYFLLWRANRRSAKACVVAAFFPPAVMGYLLGCLILSSMLSGFLGSPDLVFGDINEPLPNGFTLEALDKMPEAGHIQKAGESWIKVAWVGGVQVEGPYVLGKYDYTYSPKTDKEHDRNFFIFDTRTGDVRDYASEGALAASSGISVHLTTTPNFHAPRSPSKRIWDVLFLLLAVVPPVAWAISLVSKLATHLKAV